MAHYLTLFKFNGPIQGGGPERYKTFKATVEAVGGKIVYFGGLLGPHDVMTLCDYPDLKSAMLGATRICNLINAQSQTFPVLQEADFLDLLAQTPRT